VKADVASQVIAVGDEVEVAQDFGLRCVFLRPRPRALQFRIESVAVVDSLNVAASARISVPVPGAANIVSLVKHHCREAALAQAMEKVQAGEPGPYQRSVDLLRLRLAAARRM
jgi:hypothetical protein